MSCNARLDPGSDCLRFPPPHSIARRFTRSLVRKRGRVRRGLSSDAKAPPKLGANYADEKMLENYGFKIRAAMILERIPPVMPPLEPWEEEYEEWKLHRQNRCTREIPKEFWDPMNEVTEEMLEADRKWIEEDFVPAPFLTDADHNNDTKSTQRKLCDHLWFIVKKDGEWQWVTREWEQGETIRQTANRAVLTTLDPDHFEHFILGHYPIGHFDREDTRTFYLHSLRCDGDIKLLDDGVTDWMWATKEEVLDLFPKDSAEIVQDVCPSLTFLNQWIYGGEPQECARAVSERAYNEHKAKEEAERAAKGESEAGNDGAEAEKVDGAEAEEPKQG